MSGHSVYLFCAVVGGGFFVLKTIMLLGLGIGDADHVGGSDGDHADSTDNFHVLSLQSVLAFFMGFGLMGLVGVNDWQLDSWLTLLLAICFGACLLLLNSWLFFQLRRLDSSSKVDFQTALGAEGRVYLTIHSGKTGQVEVQVSGKKMIVAARAAGDEEIPSFTPVKVTKVDESGVVEVVTLDRSVPV